MSEEDRSPPPSGPGPSFPDIPRSTSDYRWTDRESHPRFLDILSR